MGCNTWTSQHERHVKYENLLNYSGSTTRDVVLPEKVWDAPKNTAILNSFKLILKQNMKKVWERRSRPTTPLVTTTQRTAAAFS